jgi:hypothetical protein
MNRICVSAVALMAMAGAVNAQTVQFRIIERTGQTVANSADALVECAVQARVTGGNLGSFNFDIALAGEAESNGALSRARISNADHTYWTVPTNGTSWVGNSSVGSGGLASTFSYLAALQAPFNGVINTSSGTFTNNPAEHEIGLIAGAATGSALLNTPGVDGDGDGNPDNYFDNGNGNPTVNGSTASTTGIDVGTYFGNGQFTDVYRFRYTVSSFTTRTVNFVLRNIGAQVFQQFGFNNGAWGAQNVTVDAASISASGYSLSVTPAPATVALMGLGGLVAARRRRA